MSDNNEIMDGQDIKLRSEEVSEVLSNPPHWIIRWGIATLLLFILIGIALTNFIRYPDTLTAQATLTTLNPTINIIAQNTGKITQMLVKNDELVKVKEPLAVIQNTADYTDVLFLNSVVAGMNNEIKISDTVLLTKLIPTQLKLGTITPGYLEFIASFKDYKSYYATNLPEKEMQSLQNEKVQYVALLSRYKVQDTLYSDELNISKKDYQRNEKLLEEKVIASKDFEDKKKNYIDEQKNVETQKINVSNAKIAIATIENSIVQLQIQQYNEVNKLQQDLKEKLLALENALTDWKQNYLLQSPIDGKIAFLNYWSINQYIKSGEAVFAVIPQQQQKVIAKLVLPASNSGKVKKGEAVHIKLDDYPYMEYGMLNGIVTNISLVPSNNNYIVDVALSNGMKTSYNKIINFKPEMQGQANIVTENKTMLDRVFFQFKKLTVK